MERHAQQITEATGAVELQGVSKRFGNIQALKAVSIRIERGEAFSLVGPSGCGKTTVLNIIAGLLDPDEGEVFLMGQRAEELPSRDRGTVMVFQNYALFPHLTVFENIAFGLRVRKQPAPEVHQRVTRALEVVGLSGRESYYPHQLSGGQQQRVALARALVVEPPILLLDEPMSNLDARLRDQVRYELRDILRRLSVTSIFVTHDIHEAFILSDRMAVMEQGQIAQIGTSRDLYEHPVNPSIANFVGMCNILCGHIVEMNGELITVQLKTGSLARARMPGEAASGKIVDIYLRPERVLIRREGPTEFDLEGRIVRRVYLGSQIDYIIAVGDLMVRAHGRAGEAESFQTGERVFVAWNPKEAFSRIQENA